MKDQRIYVLLFSLLFAPLVWGVGSNASHWTFDPAEYAYNTNVHAALTFNGTGVEDYTAFEIAAFCGDECRGIAKPSVSQGKKYYELRVYSKKAEGEMITFKCYNQATGRELKVAETLSFDGEQHGTLSHLFQLTATQPVTGVSLDKTAVTLNTTETYTLVATVAPDDASNKSITWSSSDPAIASVSDAGLVTALKAGETTITVTTVDGEFTATCAVTVLQPVNGVSLDKTAVTLNTTETCTLVATVAPDDASNKSITWKSSDPAIASVDDAGLVTALKAGEATITVTTVDGDFTATCAVTVLQPVNGVTLDKTEVTLKVAETTTLQATVLPLDASDKSVTWSSDNDDIVTVDDAGKITAVAVGSAVITVMTVDGNHTATCQVTVVPIWVESVKIACEEEQLKLTPEQQTLHFTALVLPADATDKELVWSIESGDDMATISQDGVLRAVDGIKKDGEVVVRATASDRSEVYDEVTVTLEGFATGIHALNQHFIFVSSPVRNHLCIQGDFDRLACVSIINTSGQICIRAVQLPSGESIDVSSLSKGVYYILIEQGMEQVVEKIIKIE